MCLHFNWLMHLLSLLSALLLATPCQPGRGGKGTAQASWAGKQAGVALLIPSPKLKMSPQGCPGSPQDVMAIIFKKRSLSYLLWWFLFLIQRVCVCLNQQWHHLWIWTCLIYLARAGQAAWGERVRRNVWRWLGAPSLSELGDQKVTRRQKYVRCVKGSAGRLRPCHFSTAFLSHHAGPRDTMTGHCHPPASGVGGWWCEERQGHGSTGRGLCGSATNWRALICSVPCPSEGKNKNKKSRKRLWRD